MPILPGHLNGRFFPTFATPIAEAGPHPTWTFVQASTPFVAIHVLNQAGNPQLGIVFDATDWPHRPPRATPCSTDFRRVFQVRDCAPFLIPGDNHIYDSSKRPGTGAYFCVEGTREFHEDYADALPWESVRHLGNFSPVAIINNVVALVRRL